MRIECITIKLEDRVSTNKIYWWVHFWVRKKYKDFFHDLIQENIKDIHPFEKRVNLRFDFFFEKRPYDSSNCSFMGKMLEDWMTATEDSVWNKVLPLLDWDSLKSVWDFTLRSHKSYKWEWDYVVITITEE